MRDFKEGMNMWMNRYDRILFYELTDKLRLTLITDQRKRKKICHARLSQTHVQGSFFRCIKIEHRFYTNSSRLRVKAKHQTTLMILVNPF